MSTPCTNTDWQEPEESREGLHVHMTYDFSADPEDLTRWTDHEIALMHAQAVGHLKAALGEVLKLRRTIGQIVKEQWG